MSKSKNCGEKNSQYGTFWITDGKENRSTEFTKAQVFEKIAKREKKGWNFIYLGANQDAMEEGSKIGIKLNNTTTWSADSKGVKLAFVSTSNYATKFRNAKSTGEINSLDLNQEYKDAEKQM